MARTLITASGVATHKEDDAVLATAVSGAAAYLVSGDRQLQRLGAYSDVVILSPRMFVETVLDPDGAEAGRL